MTTLFDDLPMSFTPETIDMVTREYISLQYDSNRLDMSDPDISDRLKATIVRHRLSEVTDSSNGRDKAIVRLAASCLAWVEAINASE